MSNEKKLPYSFTFSENALGVTAKFLGPNMPQYSHEVMFIQPLCDWAIHCMETHDRPYYEVEAEHVCRLLNAAFQAGRAEMASELRQLILLK